MEGSAGARPVPARALARGCDLCKEEGTSAAAAAESFACLVPGGRRVGILGF
jgi:hypothetical protein